MKKAMKRVKSKKKEKSTATATSPADLSSFTVAAAISEASQHSSQPQQQQPRKIFSIPPSPVRFGSENNIANASQVSLATSTSFATAYDSAQHTESVTPAASYFVDSSDDETNETNEEDLGFDRDPLGIFSREQSTPTEITISSNQDDTMPSKKSTKKIVPEAFIPEATAVPPPAAAAPKDLKKDPKTDEAHFDVAQNVYGTAKNVWAWGTTVPVVATFLGLTETVAAKVLETTIHMDLPAVDQEGVTPQLKKLDDDLITPAILAIWKIIEPAVGKADEMIVKPVLTEVVPRVLAPLSMFDSKKKEEKAIEADPAVVPALN